jgi:hypothetical protein
MDVVSSRTYRYLWCMMLGFYATSQWHESASEYPPHIDYNCNFHPARKDHRWLSNDKTHIYTHIHTL